jgi:hypothetical protein
MRFPGARRAGATALLGLGCAASLLAAHGHAGPVAGTLEIRVEGGELRATMVYRNLSARDVWLERIPEGQAPPRSEFEIRADGRQVAYTGPQARPGPRTRDEFFPLKPGQSHRREVRIDDRYDFPEGSRAYTATHTYLTWNVHTRREASRSLKPATFTYGR